MLKRESYADKKRARNIHMEMWRWLYQNPGKDKINMPRSIRLRLSVFLYQHINFIGSHSCTLCSVFVDCADCILLHKKTGSSCHIPKGLYNKWFKSINSNNKRVLERGQAAAYKIYCAGRDWEIEKDS